MKPSLLSLGLLFVATGCCVVGGKPTHALHCEEHVEGPFCLEAGTYDPSGPGLVFGTVDFTGGATVLVKVQVEDLTAVDGNTGTVRAWSGNGDLPQSASQLDPDDLFYESAGVVSLRHWTTHILREYEPGAGYWVVVEVHHRNSSGNPIDPARTVKWWWPDPASIPSPPDTPHDFNEY
jgi:hypothetical protein